MAGQSGGVSGFASKGAYVVMALAALILVMLAVSVAGRWLHTSYTEPVSREDVVAISGIVLSVAGIVIASFTVISLYLLFQSNQERQRVTEQIRTDEAKIAALDGRIEGMNKELSEFQKPEELLQEMEAIAGRKAQESLEAIRRDFRPSEQVERDILLKLFQVLVAPSAPSRIAEIVDQLCKEASASERP